MTSWKCVITYEITTIIFILFYWKTFTTNFVFDGRLFLNAVPFYGKRRMNSELLDLFDKFFILLLPQ